MPPLDDLLCWTRGGWAPLPAWARCLIEVGRRVVRSEPDEGRLVVALALPARAFGAAFVAASAVVAAFEADAPDSDGGEHFELLASLPPGTPVTHHRGNSIEQGRLLGIDSRDGIRRVKIETRKMTYYLPAEMCGSIQVIADPGQLKMTKRKLIRAPGFLSRALPGIATAAALSATTRLDCIVVGSVNPLQYELVTERFGAGPESGIREGNLQGLVRAKRFSGQNAPYRSDVVAAAGDTIPDIAAETSPPVVIFDGATGFINWRSRWPNSNWVVLLDRSSPSTPAGADTINYYYSTRLNDSDVLGDLALPRSIEAIAYIERK
jgi:hypothetical protein